jgi:hypothetical protein
MQQSRGDRGDFFDRSEKRLLIGFGRLIEAGYFSNKLQRSCPDFVAGNRRIKIKQCFNISAHRLLPDVFVIFSCFSVNPGLS